MMFSSVITIAIWVAGYFQAGVGMDCQNPMPTQNVDWKKCGGTWYIYAQSDRCDNCCTIRISDSTENLTTTQYLKRFSKSNSEDKYDISLIRSGNSVTLMYGSDPNPMQVLGVDCEDYVVLKWAEKMMVLTRSKVPSSEFMAMMTSWSSLDSSGSPSAMMMSSPTASMMKRSSSTPMWAPKPMMMSAPKSMMMAESKPMMMSESKPMMMSDPNPMMMPLKMSNSLAWSPSIVPNSETPLKSTSWPNLRKRTHSSKRAQAMMPESSAMMMSEPESMMMSEPKPMMMSESKPMMMSETKRTMMSEPKPMMMSDSKPMTISESKQMMMSESKPLMMSESKPMMMSEPKPMMWSDSKPMMMSGSKPMMMSEPKPMMWSDSKPMMMSESKPLMMSEPKPMMWPDSKPMLSPTTVPTSESHLESAWTPWSNLRKRTHPSKRSHAQIMKKSGDVSICNTKIYKHNPQVACLK